MRYYYLKTLRQRQPDNVPVLSIAPASLTLDRSAPGNTTSFTASLSFDPGRPTAVTVSSSDPSVTVSPATFALGGGNPIVGQVTVTGAETGPDSVTISVNASGQPSMTIPVTRPPVPLSLSVSPNTLTLERVAPGNVADVSVSLNRVPDSAVLVSVSSSDSSVAVFPASFSLSTGNPPSRNVTLTGALSGPNSVTISVNPLNLPSRTVSVSRPAFSPALLNGLALWLDAADASTITLDGANNVSQWNDKSGNGRHFGQSDAARRPSYSLASINGLNCVSYDGVNDIMTRAAEAWAYEYPVSVFVVFRATAFTSSYNSLWDWYTSSAGNTSSHTGLIKSNGKSAIYISTTDGQTNYDGTGAITYATGQTYQFFSTITANSITSRGNQQADGSHSATFTPRTTPLGTLPMEIGASGKFSRFTAWRIAEFLLYTNSTLSTASRDAVEAYLKAKWGTS